MKDESRFKKAIKIIDQANSEDPRSEIVEGKPQPKELLFARRVAEWIPKLTENPSETLLLAARGHTVRRWRIPRDAYAMDNLGYHEWRDALAQFHADETAAILTDVGYDDATIDAVRALITKKNFPDDPDSKVLEDADCLVFLETKLVDYLDDWDEQKTVNILKRTVRKMTPKGASFIAKLNLDPRSRAIVEKAMA